MYTLKTPQAFVSMYTLKTPQALVSMYTLKTPQALQHPFHTAASLQPQQLLGR